MAKKSEYMQKAVVFGGKKLVLFSLDGVTWSSRKDELRAIMERHEQEKITINDIRGVAEDTEETKGAAENADDKAHDILAEDEPQDEKAGGRKGRKLKLVEEEDDLDLEDAAEEAPVASARTRGRDPLRETRRSRSAGRAAPAAKPKAAGKGKAAVASPKKRSSSAPLKKSPPVKGRRKAAA